MFWLRSTNFGLIGMFYQIGSCNLSDSVLKSFDEYIFFWQIRSYNLFQISESKIVTIINHIHENDD